MTTSQVGSVRSRLLIFSDQSLFAAGIQDLLRKQENLLILGCVSDLEQVLQSIDRDHPDLVLHTTWNEADNFAPALIAILKQDPAVKVVDVNLQSNALHIYGKQLRVVHEAGDLLEAIGEVVSDQSPHPDSIQAITGRKTNHENTL